MLKGSLRIRRDQQETPYALQETVLRSWYRIGEAYSAFRGWRPIPAALPSHSIELVPGPKNFLPTSHPPLSGGPYYFGENTPDKTQSIKKLGQAVKFSWVCGSGKNCGKTCPFFRHQGVALFRWLHLLLNTVVASRYNDSWFGADFPEGPEIKGFQHVVLPFLS